MTTRHGEFHRGWTLVLALHLATAFGVSVMLPYSIGVLVEPLSAAFGWSRREIGLAISIFSLSAFIASFIVGALVDRFGVRRVLLVSQIGLSLCFVLYASMTTLWQFYAISFLMPLLGGGTMVISSTKAINMAFIQRRGLALGLMLAGSGVGGFVLPLVATTAYQMFNWRASFAALALMPLLLALPACFRWVRDDRAKIVGTIAAPNAAQTVGRTLREAVRDYRFWIIVVSFFGGSWALVGILSNLAPILTSIGYTPIKAAGMMSIFGIAVLVGRLVVGVLLDRLWAPLVGTFICLPAAVALLTLGVATKTSALIPILVAVIGLACGSEYDLSSYLIARYFGLASYGKIYAAVFAAFAAGGIISPALYGWAHETQGSYALGIWTSAAGFTVCAFLPWMLGRYPSAYAPSTLSGS